MRSRDSNALGTTPPSPPPPARAVLCLMQSYKTQICPHGSRCRSKAFCPHAHLFPASTVRSKSTSAIAGGFGGAGFSEREAGAIGDKGMRRPRPGTPDGSGNGAGEEMEEEWHTVQRRGRRVPSPAESEGQVRGCTEDVQ